MPAPMQDNHMDTRENMLQQRAIRVLKTFSQDPSQSGRVTLAIRSAFFGSYLRLDGCGCGGGGDMDGKGPSRVTSSAHVGLWEMFRLVPQSDGTVAIQSVLFDSWLCMDARGMDMEPGGVVTCQAQVGPMERFNLVPQDDGTVAIQSAHFGTYLRIESIGISMQPCGGGTVNCSRELRSWEKFIIQVIHPVYGIKATSTHTYLRMDCHQPDVHDKEHVSGERYLGDWEKFELIWMNDYMVGIKSTAFHNYISVQDGGKRVGYSPSLGPQEQFTLVMHNDGSVSFRGVECRLYLSMSTSRMVSCNETVGHTEKFALIIDC